MITFEVGLPGGGSVHVLAHIWTKSIDGLTFYVDSAVVAHVCAYTYIKEA